MSEQSDQQKPKKSLKDLLAEYDTKKATEEKKDEKAYNSAKRALEAGKANEVTNEDLVRVIRHSKREAERGENE